MTVIISILSAFVSAVVGFLIWGVEKKLDTMESNNRTRDREQIELRAAERDLLFAEAKISALTARVARGEIVNGDLERAERELADKKKILTDITNRIVAEFLEI